MEYIKVIGSSVKFQKFAEDILISHETCALSPCRHLFELFIPWSPKEKRIENKFNFERIQSLIWHA